MIKKNSIITALDLGSSKIACFIVKINDEGEGELLGVGHQESRGIRGGIITNIPEAEYVISSAVQAAEEMADFHVEEVIVGLSGNHLLNDNISVDLNIGGNEINDNDIIDIIREACKNVKRPEYELIHFFTSSYRLDGVKGIKDPRFMIGEQLSADIFTVSAKQSQLQNIINCLAKCHLDVVSYVVSSYSSALSVLKQDEMDLGVTVIDIGSRSTDFSIFHEGKNIYSSSVALGGAHITGDLAKVLSTSVAGAERLKKLYGGIYVEENDDNEMIEILELGGENENETEKIAKSHIISIIKPRVEEIFEMIRDEIELSTFFGLSGRRCVITGGTSQLKGIIRLASEMFSKQARIGRPLSLNNIPDAVSGPAFSTVSGMIKFSYTRTMEEELVRGRKILHDGESGVEKIFRWLRSNF